MPTFFFDLEQDGEVEADQIGTELPDMAAARNEAVETLAGIAKDFLPTDGPRKILAISIRQASGKQLYKCQLSFAEDPPDWGAH